ncbi:MAG: ATP-binding protein [Planctomycetaceae bacterium]
MGLPTVRRIVEAHRGQIVCESEPGRGTRFSVSLPIGLG